MSKFVILHKRKTPQFCVLYNESDQTNICNIHEKEDASYKYYTSFIFYIQPVKKLNLCKFYSNRVINHLMSILISIFISGYHGKTTDFAKNSSCHRTTIAHFLNSGKWDDTLLSDTLKQSVIEIIYSEAARTGKPVFCIADDTIASKTKPSSQALHPIEDAYFHQSHLKGKQDYGHQAVAVMLSCNGIVLNYAFAHIGVRPQCAPYTRSIQFITFAFLIFLQSLTFTLLKILHSSSIFLHHFHRKLSTNFFATSSHSFDWSKLLS